MTTRADAESAVEQLRSVGKLFGVGYSAHVYSLETLVALFGLAKFKVGDRVRLSRAPEISSEKSWGWMGAKHFLVAGAVATVQTVEARRDPPGFCYGLTFDDESWVDSKGDRRPVDRPSLYVFGESSLDAALPT